MSTYVYQLSFASIMPTMAMVSCRMTSNTAGENQSTAMGCKCRGDFAYDSLTEVDQWSGDRRVVASTTARVCAKGDGKFGNCSRKGARRPLQGLVWLLTFSVLPLCSAQTGETTSPTDAPAANYNRSLSPSETPSVEPTFNEVSEVSAAFNQRFQIGNNAEFNDTEKVAFCNTFANYTDDFGGGSYERVNTTCEIVGQSLQVIGGTRRGLKEGPIYGALGFVSRFLSKQRKLQVVFNQVDYVMSYWSWYENVTGYPALFQTFVNNDLDRVTADLQNASLSAVESSFLTFNTIPAPPTQSPLEEPTVSPHPTGMPSIESQTPTFAPSPSFSRDPAIPAVTEMPTMIPSNNSTAENSSRFSTSITAVSVILVSVVALVALFLFWRRRKQRLERKYQEEAASGAVNGGRNQGVGRENMRVETGAPYQEPLYGKHEGEMVSPADSLRSKESMISGAPSPLSEGSEREEDRTHTLTDEFAQYQDQNLEAMRTGVEGSLSGFDGMMSQALTKILMDDDAEAVNEDELRWKGCNDSPEIEATALWEVTDWLKRNESATIEEKSAYMQETLNKMVASVRHGVMDPECGSRSIHECAALLGLQLATDLPGDALIVTGMPKWVQAPDLLPAFKEFGEIESAAVASGDRGFGVVRFKSTKYAQNALLKFRTGEIVVQDVAVMVKVLKSNESSRTSFPPPPDTSLSRHSSRAESPIVNDW